MTARSDTRLNLERSIRALVPDRQRLQESVLNEPPAIAAAGLGGLVTGYAWGWLRTRRQRKRSGR